MKPRSVFPWRPLAAFGFSLLAMAALAASLSDYGSLPTVAKPPQDQLDANQKLDFHTDRYTGRFAYNIPIQVPPARGGSQPRVALEYNSANKNGWCGVGWELEMGYIQRETRQGTPVSGGKYSDDFGFVFSFNGHSGRLINVGGSNYCAQINTDFLKFAYSNGWWMVTDKSGTKYNFGETTASRIANNFGTFKWALSSIRDANGNYSLLSYTNDLSQLYLKEIDYNGNDNSPAIATNCAVAFDLISTNRYDTNSTFIAGSEVQTRKLLGAVRVLSGGQLVRRYALSYITSPSTRRALLQKVTEFGSDNTSSLPPHTFTYSEQAASFKAAAAWAVTGETGSGKGTVYGSTPGTPDSQLVDIDGDGLPDWVTINNSLFNKFLVQFNTGSGFTSSQYAWSPLANEGGDSALAWNELDSQFGNGDGSIGSLCQLTDVNGDNLPDRVMRSYFTPWNHFGIQTNTGTGFSSMLYLTGLSGVDSTYETATTTTSDGEASRSLLVDINGDGLPDHVMDGSFSGQFSVQFNLGGSFGSAVAWTNVVGDLGSYLYAPRDRGSVDLSGNSHVYSELMDLNGDGLPDRVLSSGVQLNNGVRGFASYQTTWNYSGEPEIVSVSEGAYTAQLLDVNGDSLPDFVVSNGNGTYRVKFNTGRGFSGTSVTWTGVNTSGDGTAGWNELQAWDGYGTKVLFIDMNGDGLLDRVERNYNSTSSILVQLATGPFPDLLISVSNGLGGSVTVQYTNSTVLDNSDGTRPRLPFPVYVVTALTQKDGRGNSATSTYDYSAGLYDTTYREFRGFGVVTETDPLNAYTITWFHQGGGTNGSALGEYNDDLAKAGMPYRVETYGSDGKLYSRVINTVDEVKVHSNGVYFPFIRQTITQDYEANSGYRATAAGYAYDAVTNNLAASTGNLLGQTNYGEVLSVNIANHTFTTTNTTAPVYRQLAYAAIPSNPDIIDRVAVETTSADGAGAAVLRQTTNSYYDVTGDLKTRADLICPGTYAVTSYGYDVYGNLTSTTDPVGVVVTSDYDTATATYPTRKYTGSLGDNLIEYSLYDPRSGAILATTNMAGLVTENDYDVFFRITNSAISTAPNGSPTLTRAKYEYKLGGVSSGGVSSNYVRLLQNDPASATGFHETYTYFDGLERVIQTRAQAEAANQYRVSDLVYDDRGAVMLESYPSFANNAGYGKLPAASRTNYVYTEYDKIGRAFRVNPCAKATFTSGGILSGNPAAIAGDSGSPTGPTSIAYKDGSNPWSVVVTNALGNIHKYNLDAFGRTNEIVEVTSTGNFTSELAYNPAGDLTNLTDSAENQSAIFVNLLGEKIAEADPDRGFWQYGLDAAGRLTAQTDARGDVIRFGYSDPAGRLKSRVSYTSKGAVSASVTNYYDSNLGDSDFTVYPGQLYMTTDSEGWEKFSHDVRGRTVKSVRYLSKNGQTYTNQFAYDDADRLVSTAYPNGGPVVTNIFDAGQNLSQVKLVGGANTVFYSAKGFNQLDQLIGVNFGNSVQTTNLYYNVSHRLRQITTLKTANIQSLAYTYTANGNIAAITDGVYSGAASGTFGAIAYDDLDRLVSYTNTSGSFAFSYDSTGNMVTNRESGTEAYFYGTIRPHFVRSANDAWYTSDQNGDMVFRNGQRLDYNADNQLFRVVATNGLITTFGYGASGERLWKLTSTNTLQVWIGGNYEEKNGQVLYHVLAAGRTVCTFDKTGTNVFEYYHPDDPASTSVQTDQSGNEVQHYSYTAFGQSRYTQSATAFPVSRRYTAQILDEDTGLYFYNFRYYDPQLGRFTQPDDTIPDVGDPQSWNRYAYCLNNPLRFTDPSGHGAGEALADAVLNTGTIKSSYQLMTMHDTAGWKAVEIPVGVLGIAAGTMDAAFNVATLGGKAAATGAVKEGAKVGAEAIAKATAKEAASTVAKGVEKETPQILKSAAAGRAWEKQVTKDLQKTQNEVVEQVTVKTKSGTKTRLDNLGRAKETGAIKASDAKGSASAPLTKNQAKGYPEIERSGATIVGKGKPGFPGGMKIPPTKVDIIRRQ